MKNKMILNIAIVLLLVVSVSCKKTVNDIKNTPPEFTDNRSDSPRDTFIRGYNLDTDNIKIRDFYEDKIIAEIIGKKDIKTIIEGLEALEYRELTGETIYKSITTHEIVFNNETKFRFDIGTGLKFLVFNNVEEVRDSGKDTIQYSIDEDMTNNKVNDINRAF